MYPSHRTAALIKKGTLQKTFNLHLILEEILTIILLIINNFF